jgi:hypothetical protein
VFHRGAFANLPPCAQALHLRWSGTNSGWMRKELQGAVPDPAGALECAIQQDAPVSTAWLPEGRGWSWVGSGRSTAQYAIFASRPLVIATYKFFLVVDGAATVWQVSTVKPCALCAVVA